MEHEPIIGEATRRTSISDKIKIFVWQRDNGKCVKCGSQHNLEFDHDIPISMGGSNSARNLQLLCESCNRAKGGSLV
jgi:5-methylcytosine-specific restriction endonuclease McrA